MSSIISQRFWANLCSSTWTLSCLHFPSAILCKLWCLVWALNTLVCTNFFAFFGFWLLRRPLVCFSPLYSESRSDFSQFPMFLFSGQTVSTVNYNCSNLSFESRHYQAIYNVALVTVGAQLSVLTSSFLYRVEWHKGTVRNLSWAETASKHTVKIVEEVVIVA